MKVIRFEVEGVLNSFKIPFFRTYHKTLLSPPKTAIIGMLCNISLKSQKVFFEILNKNLVLVSVIINKIEGKTKDLWSYKTLDKNNRGKSIIRRDKLYKIDYTIYLKIRDNTLYESFYNSLKNPQNIPSLGMDDEIVFIKNVNNNVPLKENKSNIVDSIFLDKGYKYKIKAKDISKEIMLPTFHQIPTKFKAFNKKGRRIPKEPIKDAIYNQIEFINCEVEFLEKVESFIDLDSNNRIIFS